MIHFFLLLTWVIVYKSWGYPSIGAPTTLTHGKVGWVGGVLILDVGLLRGHGRRHCYPGILGLLSQTSQWLLALIVQPFQPVRILRRVDARQEIVGGVDAHFFRIIA